MRRGAVIFMTVFLAGIPFVAADTGESLEKLRDRDPAVRAEARRALAAEGASAVPERPVLPVVELY